jgi:uncharacterized caspase-like protein
VLQVTDRLQSRAIILRRETEAGFMRIWITALALVAAFATANVAHAEKRVALVLGNGNYKYAPKHDNPVGDADAMSALLRKIGFDVIEATDGSRDVMTERFLEFGKKAEGADLALFYYAGQGISVGGSDYLLAVDADIKSEMDVKLGGAIDTALTIDQTMSAAKTKIVLLDTSRSDPFARQMPAKNDPKGSRAVRAGSGLAEMRAADNSLFAFAVGPGQMAPDGPKGGHSPFTKALLDNIAAPGVEIQEAMTKVRAEVASESTGAMPWGNSNLSFPVYLNPAPKDTGK